MWRSLTVAVALSVGLVAPSSVLAVGGPVSPVQGTPVGAARSPYRYIAVADGSQTLLKRLGPGSARAELRVSGRYGIPAVNYGGLTTGLSADGRTLVLAEVPAAAVPRLTRLLVLGTPRLAIRARIALIGRWTVDAVSPDGRWLYLIHYRSDLSHYEVRAYDLAARRLLVKPVVDPHDWREAMAGIAI